jgi:hypothetical protein
MLALEQFKQITQNPDRFEQVATIKDMVKSLTELRKVIENGLVEDGLAEYQIQIVKEHIVREHERKVFKKV